MIFLGGVNIFPKRFPHVPMLHADESMSCQPQVPRIPYLAKKGHGDESAWTAGEENRFISVIILASNEAIDRDVRLVGTGGFQSPLLLLPPSPQHLHDSSISLQEQDKCDGSKMNSLLASC